MKHSRYLCVFISILDFVLTYKKCFVSLSFEATRIFRNLQAVWRCETRITTQYHPHKRNNKRQHWSFKLSLLVHLRPSLFSLSAFHFRSTAFQEKRCLPGAHGPFWNYHHTTNMLLTLGIGKRPGHHQMLTCLPFFPLEKDLADTRMYQVASAQVYLVKQELCRYNLCAWKSSLAPRQLSPSALIHKAIARAGHTVTWLGQRGSLGTRAALTALTGAHPGWRGDAYVIFHVARVLSKVYQFWVWMLLRNVSPKQLISIMKTMVVKRKIPQLDKPTPPEESENRREVKYFKLTRGITLNCNLSQKHFDTEWALVHPVSRALHTMFKTTLVWDGISLNTLANLV